MEYEIYHKCKGCGAISLLDINTKRGIYKLTCNCDLVTGIEIRDDNLHRFLRWLDSLEIWYGFKNKIQFILDPAYIKPHYYCYIWDYQKGRIPSPLLYFVLYDFAEKDKWTAHVSGFRRGSSNSSFLGSFAMKEDAMRACEEDFNERKQYE